MEIIKDESFERDMVLLDALRKISDSLVDSLKDISEINKKKDESILMMLTMITESITDLRSRIESIENKFKIDIH